MGLGASLGPAARHLELAARLLARHGRMLATSRIWSSPPAGGVATGRFLNAAVLLATPLGLLELLDACQDIEARLGRVRARRWADRTVDLDLLWSPGLQCRLPALVLPHPRLAERSFAIGPLLDLVPDATPPGGGPSYALLADRARPLAAPVAALSTPV